MSAHLYENLLQFCLSPLKQQQQNFCFSFSKLKKLSEDSLTKQPEEVFDVLEKLGEG